ncbi:MAG: hypothetical protein SNJ75_12970, partial [Gemmataceae bacterium]
QALRLADLERFSMDSNTLVRTAAAEALGKLLDVAPESRTILNRMIGDEALAVARVAQEALLKAPQPPAAPPLTAESSPLPADLREQAPAARAYLQRWRSHRPPEKIAVALDTLLEVLD